MSFLTTDDYAPIVTTAELNAITGNSATDRQKAEAMAINKIKHTLSRKFDTAAIFDAVGAARDVTVVEYTIYYTLYILYTRLSKSKVPDDRFAQYNEASKFFKALSSDQINSTLPRVADGSDSSDGIGFRFESSDAYGTFY